MGQPDPVFLEALPAAQRKSRDEMIAVANKYYDGIEQSKGSIVPFDPTCNRVQNGLKTTNNPDYKPPAPMTWNPLALGCKDQLDTGFFSFIRKVYPRRFLVVDEERGLVFGSFLFQIPGTVKSINVPGQVAIPMASHESIALHAGCSGAVQDRKRQNQKSGSSAGAAAVWDAESVLREQVSI